MKIPTTLTAPSPMFDSGEFVLQIALKNPGAFSSLYDAYAPALFGYIKRRITHSPGAEKILQDVFIKIWNCSDTYCASKTSYFSWMIAIANKEIISCLRGKQSAIESLAILFPAAIILAL